MLLFVYCCLGCAHGMQMRTLGEPARAWPEPDLADAPQDAAPPGRARRCWSWLGIRNAGT